MRSRSSAASGLKSAHADPVLDADLRRILKRLPMLEASGIRIERHKGLRDRRGPVHGGSFLRERRIALDCTRAELPRILVHELFHFVWLRLGNPLRRSYEDLLRQEELEQGRW